MTSGWYDMHIGYKCVFVCVIKLEKFIAKVKIENRNKQKYVVSTLAMA